jgi:hypothetical protein
MQGKIREADLRQPFQYKKCDLCKRETLLTRDGTDPHKCEKK